MAPSMIRGMYMTVILCLFAFKHKSKKTIVDKIPTVSQNPSFLPNSYWERTITIPYKTIMMKRTVKKSSVFCSSDAMKQKVRAYASVI